MRATVCIGWRSVPRCSYPQLKRLSKVSDSSLKVLSNLGFNLHAKSIGR